MHTFLILYILVSSKRIFIFLYKYMSITLNGLYIYIFEFNLKYENY